MGRKTFFIVSIVLLGLFLNALTVTAEVFYVEVAGSDENDGSETNPWGTIQGAVDNASVEDGDVIYIGTGSFSENVNINKSITLYGNGTKNTIITAEDADDHVFRVSANDVAIRNLTIKGADGSNVASVHAAIDDFSLRYCLIQNSEYGIYLKNSDYPVIYSNTFKNNDIGLYVYNADDADISYNDFSGNTVGLWIVRSEIDAVDANEFDDGNYGIFLEETDDDDDYYSDDDITELEENNDFDDLEIADIYQGDADELEEDTSCFIRTLFPARGFCGLTMGFPSK